MISYKMASTIYRLSSLVVILTILLSGFGSPIKITTHYDKKRDSELNVTCVAEAPKHLKQRTMMIQITRQGQVKPITSMVVNENQEMAPYSTGNMKAYGYFDNHSSKSSLNLTIKNPGVYDAGFYSCVMFVLQQNYTITKESDALRVQLDRPDINGLLIELNAHISSLTAKIGELQSRHEKITQTINKQNFDMFTFQNQACPDEGWAFYQVNETNMCLKVFGNYHSDELRSWPKARQECQLLGGDLVQIYNDEEQNFVLDLVNDMNWPIWIGIKNSATNALDFKYVNGSSLGDYEQWYPGYPDIDKDAACVLMIMNALGSWYHKDCSLQTRYVCSKPSRCHC